MSNEKSLLSSVKRFLFGAEAKQQLRQRDEELRAEEEAISASKKKKKPTVVDLRDESSSQSSSESSPSPSVSSDENDDDSIDGVDAKMQVARRNGSNDKSNRGQAQQFNYSDHNQVKQKHPIPAGASTVVTTTTGITARKKDGTERQEEATEIDALTVTLLKFKGRLISSMPKHELEDHLDTLGLSNRGTKAELLSRLTNAVLALRNQKSILVDDLFSVRQPLTGLSEGLNQEKYERLRKMLLARVQLDDEDSLRPRATGASSSISAAMRNNLGQIQATGFARTPGAAFGAGADLTGGKVKRSRMVEFAEEVQSYPSNEWPVTGRSSGVGNAPAAPSSIKPTPSSVLKRPRESLGASQMGQNFASPAPSADEVAKRILSTLGRLATPIDDALSRPPPTSDRILDRSRQQARSSVIPGGSQATVANGSRSPVPLNIPKQSSLHNDEEERARPRKLARGIELLDEEDETSPVAKEIKTSTVNNTSLATTTTTTNTMKIEEIKPKFVFSPAPPSATKLVIPPPSAEELSRFSFDASEKLWTCEGCGVDNDESRSSCSFCQKPRVEILANGAAAGKKPVAVAIVESKPTRKEEPKPPKKAQPVLIDPSDDPFEKFRPKPGQWRCPACSVLNDAAKTQCVSCESPKPDNVGSGSTAAPTAAPKTAEKQVNFGKEEKYVFKGMVVQEEKPSSSLTAAEKLFTFGSAPTSDNTTPAFNFGQSAASSSSTAPQLFGGSSSASSAEPFLGGMPKMTESSSKQVLSSNASQDPPRVPLFGDGENKSVLFGSAQPSESKPVFGGSNTESSKAPLFGSGQAESSKVPLFGQVEPAKPPSFGGLQSESAKATSFGAQPSSVASSAPAASNAPVSGSSSGTLESKPVFTFGSSAAPPSSGPAGFAFGSSANGSTGGESKPFTFGSESSATQSAPSSGGLFVFGTQSTAASTPASAPAFGAGQSSSNSALLFGANQSASTSASGPFGGGATAPATTASHFGGSAGGASQTTAFGGSNGPMFGGNANQAANPGIFGSGNSTSATPALFGAGATGIAPSASTSQFGGGTSGGASGASSMFGGGALSTGNPLLFGNAKPNEPARPSSAPPASMFGGASAGQQQQSNTGFTFGAQPSNQPTQSNGAFTFGGQAPQTSPTPPPQFGGGFGGAPTQPIGFGGGSSNFGAAPGGGMFGVGPFGGTGQATPFGGTGGDAFGGGAPQGVGFGMNANSGGGFSMGVGGAPPVKRIAKRPLSKRN